MFRTACFILALVVTMSMNQTIIVIAMMLIVTFVPVTVSRSVIQVLGTGRALADSFSKFDVTSK
jgi:hypothetical protein